MDVLVKGMKMPTCCDDCFALDDSGDYPHCLISHDQRGYTFRVDKRRMPSCPLVEVPTWIPVTERLPENDKTVLVWNRRNSREYFDVCDHGRWIVLRQEDITHWMPLPEPPKEETDG